MDSRGVHIKPIMLHAIVKIIVIGTEINIPLMIPSQGKQPQQHATQTGLSGYILLDDSMLFSWFVSTNYLKIE